MYQEKQMYIYNGKEYSLDELSKFSSVSRSTLWIRINKCNWPVEKAVHTNSLSENKNHICIYKKKILDLSDVARLHGLSKYCIYKRINRGETLQHIVDNPNKRKTYKYKNKEYISDDLFKLPACAVSKGLFFNRLRNGWSVEDALTKRPSRPKTYEFRGKFYSLRELSKLEECAVKYLTLRARIEGYKWDVEKAMTKPAMK